MSAIASTVPDPGAAASGVRVWSTSSVAPGDAAAYWRDVVSYLYVTLSTAPALGTVFSGQVSHRGYGGFQLSVIRASAEEVRRTRSLIARGREEDEYLYATVQTRGRGRLEQAGRTACLTPGSVVFYDTSKPFALTFDEDWEQVIAHVPVTQALAAAGLKRGDELLAMPLDPAGAAAVTAAFFRSLAHAQREDPEGAELLAHHAQGVLASTLNLVAAKQGRTSVGAARHPDFIRRQRVVAFLRSRLADPDLDADTVAQSCYMSRRTLYRLFEGTEGSVMGRLRWLRIDTARQMLRQHPGRSVSSVAEACGFPSDTQFHRVFREMTGTTPAAYRADSTPGGDQCGDQQGDLTAQRGYGHVGLVPVGVQCLNEPLVVEGEDLDTGRGCRVCPGAEGD